jgi:Flp pilus assembly protein TadD
VARTARILIILATAAVLCMAAWLAFRPVQETAPEPPPDGDPPPAVGTGGGRTDPVRPPENGPPAEPVLSLDEIRGVVLAGDTGKGIRHLDRLIEREPKNEKALDLRARTHLEMRWWRQADRDYRLAARAGGETPARLHGRAEALMNLRQGKEAERLVLRALEQENEGDGPSARTHALLALIHLQNGREEEAKDELHRALLLDPEDRIALQVKARLE